MHKYGSSKKAIAIIVMAIVLSTGVVAYGGWYELDQSQEWTANNAFAYIGSYSGEQRRGQTFQTGASVTNVGRIEIGEIRSPWGATRDLQVSLYDNVNLDNLLGQTTVPNAQIPTDPAGWVTATFATPIDVLSSTSYFFMLELVGTGSSFFEIRVPGSSPTPYANGGTYHSTDGAAFNNTGWAYNDLVFRTYEYVPEPTTVALLSFGGMVGLLRRRRIT